MYESSSNNFNKSLNDAFELFNNQKWYEAHDALEEIWNGLNGEERQLIQGILQVSVSQFHLNKGNINGQILLKFGLAAGTYFKNLENNKQTAVIATDTRLSGYTL